VENENCTGDRRRSERFPIQRDIRYRVLSSKGKETIGTGQTLNMSSGGLLFIAENVLIPGGSLEVSVSWPAQLNAKCGLRLVARGRIVRFQEGKAALQILQYEFRTQSIGS
jgi:c-di-GMP-binding flagellar brake protein YcgR